MASSVVIQFIETILTNTFSNTENLDKDERLNRTSMIIRCVLSPMLSLFMLKENEVLIAKIITLLQHLALGIEVVLLSNDS